MKTKGKRLCVERLTILLLKFYKVL